MGETMGAKALTLNRPESFSILERIVVGETTGRGRGARLLDLSVSSNGSLWVKPAAFGDGEIAEIIFQYPRTDRCG